MYHLCPTSKAEASISISSEGSRSAPAFVMTPLTRSMMEPHILGFSTPILIKASLGEIVEEVMLRLEA